MHDGPGFGSDAEAFRSQVCGWLTEQLAPRRTAGHDNPRDRTGLAESFERALAAEGGRRGWLGISVPAPFGGGRPADFAAAFGYEAAYHDAPLIDTAIVLAGAPLLAFGTVEQRARMLPRMVSGEIEMCIAYTEPQAGNDLAALTSTATPLADGGFVLSGHKTLLTGADKADFCLTIARTDPGVPARRGSSMFLVDMRQTGVRVIPQRTMVGYDLFEIHFDDVTLPPDALLGEPGGGWRQLAYAVEQERTGIFNLGWCQRLFDEIHAFARAGDVGSRLIDDPVVADRMAQLWVELGIGRRSAMKLVAEELTQTRSSTTASVGKVVLTELAQRLAQFGTELAGPQAGVSGTLFGPVTEGAPARGRFGYEYLFRFDGSIGVGANEVHRTAIAALALGIRAERTRSVMPGLDLLADGDPVRAAVRGALAGWELGRLAQVQESARGYQEAIWQTFHRRIGPLMSEPGAVLVALEELGAARCPLPVHAGLIQPLAAALALGPAGGRLRKAVLESGDRYALVHPGPAGIAAERADGRWRLSGHARHLTYGDSADILLLPARHGASGTLLAVVSARAPGVRLTTYPTMSCDRLTDVEFDAVTLDDEPVLGGVAEAFVAADLLGTIALCAELVGMSARLLEMTAQRMKSRHAYGAPLAALQGVQLRAADMYLDFAAARGAVAEAASLLVSGSRDSAGVVAGIAAAKVTATSSALAIVAGAHQLCGGWGLLDEAGLHHYTRAIKAAENQLGSARECRTAIARYLRT